MDDLQYGTQDKRGNWTPNEALEVGPLLGWPWSPVRLLRWLPSYFFPWNALFMAVAMIFWTWLTPSRETMLSLSFGWILYILIRNSVLILLIYGALELRLYVKRRQGTHFKYNGNFPADQPSDVFMLRSQNIDNIIRTFGTGLPIWTAYEVLLLWAWANGIGPWTTFGDSLWWLAAFAVVLPLLHELHFYCIHRLIHVPVLYRWVHCVHHNSVNPSPWSSLSMHPGRASALLVGHASPPLAAVAPAAGAIPPADQWHGCSDRPYRLRQNRNRRRARVRYSCLCSLSPPQIFRSELYRRNASHRHVDGDVARRYARSATEDDAAVQGKEDAHRRLGRRSLIGWPLSELNPCVWGSSGWPDNVNLRG